MNHAEWDCLPKNAAGVAGSSETAWVALGVGPSVGGGGLGSCGDSGMTRLIPALVLVLMIPSPAQDPCARCAGTGLLDCLRCEAALEKGVQLCSVAADCSRCRGVLVIGCVCPSPAARDSR